MFKKINLLMLALIVLISLLPAKAIKVAAAFNEGSAYQEGKYKESAQHPLGASWSKNSNYSSADATTAIEIFKSPTLLTVNPLIDEDGTIYIANDYVSGKVTSRKLYAMDVDGNIKWSRDMPRKIKGMALYSDGNIVYNDRTINMIDAKTGKDVWKQPINIGSSMVENSSELFLGSPVIDKDGHIIVVHVDGLYVFNGNGTLVSFVKNLASNSYKIRGVNLGSDGTMYYPKGYIHSYTLENNQLVKKYDSYSGNNTINLVDDTLTLLDDHKFIYYQSYKAGIVDLEKNSEVELKGPAGMRIAQNATVSNKDHSIYLPFASKYDHTLNKYNEDGELIWAHKMNTDIVSQLTLDKEGNILFIESAASNQNYLTSMSADKDTNWSVKLPDSFPSTTADIGVLLPIVMKDGTIIVRTPYSLYKVTGDTNNSDDSGTADPEPETSPEPEEKPETKLITVFNETNKYDTSSFNDESNNTVYEYTEKKDDWYKIITAPNHTKWINSTNVIEGELDDSEQTVSITRDSFGYSKPFFYSKKTDDILKKDTEVKTYGKIGDWYLTKVDGKNVWFNQDEIKLTTFTPNKLYKEPNLDTFTGGIAQPQTLNVKDIQITTNTDYWYKVQSWLGDVYTLGEQAGFGSIQTVSQSYNAKDIEAFNTPFAEASSKTLNSEVTLVGKWQDWYKTSDNLWIKIQ